ncbi:hypothetical protein [Lunatibacter salilacus]|nr:hypothetical protein [Lunatibacter salilacus]
MIFTTVNPAILTTLVRVVRMTGLVVKIIGTGGQDGSEYTLV